MQSSSDVTPLKETQQETNKLSLWKIVGTILGIGVLIILAVSTQTNQTQTAIKASPSNFVAVQNEKIQGQEDSSIAKSQVVSVNAKGVELALQNAGRDCWGGCNRRQGACSWCGTGGFCCRRNWTGNGCDGRIGGPSNHQCVNGPEIHLETCNLMNDVDLPGHDIHCRSCPNQQECANRCFGNSACNSWTFIPQHFHRRNSAATCCEKRKVYVDSWRRIRSRLISGTKNCGDSANQAHSETREVTAGPACWIHSYGRGAGYVLTNCRSGEEKNGALCYPRCRSGYYGVGPVCWQRCPSGWNDGGVFCNIWAHTVRANNSRCPWYDKCGLTFRRGCSTCPSGYSNHGCLCTRHARHFTKRTYGRGAGKPLICRPELERNGALCYPRCRSGYRGIGPVCWNTCPPSHPYACGPLMCTHSQAECIGKLRQLGDALLRNQDSGALRLLGVASALCIPICGDQEHMVCTILNTINAAVSICPLDVSKCYEGVKCLQFLGKRAEALAEGAANLLSGGTLQDFNSFFSAEGGLSQCVRQAGSWFNSNRNGCEVSEDGTFRQFASCVVPIFQGFFIDDFSSPSFYISVAASGSLGIVGGSTSLDVNFGIDGTIIFSYTTCNVLTTPDLSVGVSISMGINGNKNEIGGSGVSIGIGAGIPGTDIGVGAEIGYSDDGRHVTSIGASFGVGVGLDLIPAAATCGICNTRILGCIQTLDDIGLGYLMP